VADEGPPSYDGRNGGGRGFWGFWTSLPGVLTGVAALITAVVGVVTLVQSPGGAAPSGAPAAVASGTTPAVGPTPGTSASASSAGGTGSSAVVHGHISMSPGDHADLESGGVGNAVPNADLSLLGDGVGGHVYELTSLGGAIARFSGRAGDRAGCAAALTTHHDAYEYLSDLQVGSQLCVQTSENHVADLRVIGTPGVGVAQFVYAYTVWR
jgi:hypothetical protein